MAPKFIMETCKIGQGPECCRYLMMDPSGWECGKVTPHLKAILDGRGKAMTAQGDNCEGVEDLEQFTKEIPN